MSNVKNPLDDILERASEEVRNWPDWMRSDENRSERQRVERQRAQQCDRKQSVKETREDQLRGDDP